MRTGRPAAGLLPGLNNAVRAQERRADGGDNGAGPDGSAASVAAAFRWPVSLVEREGIGESGRNGRAGNRAPRTLPAKARPLRPYDAVRL
jgi:hypothetical protein